MTLQRIEMPDPAFVAATTPAAVYTHASGKSFIKGFELHNTNTTAENVQVYLVPPTGGGAVGTASAVHRKLNISLPANDSLYVVYPGYRTLTRANYTIQASTTTASKVTISVFGDVE